MEFTEFMLSFLVGKAASYRALRMGTLQYASLANNGAASAENAFNATLSRLKKQGLVRKEKNTGLWRITISGTAKLARTKAIQNSRLPQHTARHASGTQKNAPKNILVAFDIPHALRRYRDWIRAELRVLDFEMLQKSVWRGAGPLPESFVKNLKELNLIEYVHIFRIADKGTMY